MMIRTGNRVFTKMIKGCPTWTPIELIGSRILTAAMIILELWQYNILNRVAGGRALARSGHLTREEWSLWVLMKNCKLYLQLLYWSLRFWLIHIKNSRPVLWREWQLFFTNLISPGRVICTHLPAPLLSILYELLKYLSNRILLILIYIVLIPHSLPQSLPHKLIFTPRAKLNMW